MKFAFSLKNKLKIAFLLFCIMCCTLLIRFLEDKSVEKINESFISMYNDRLVPATDLYFIAENLYHKNKIIQETLFGDGAVQPSIGIVKMNKHNRKIDSIINKYELTLLVKQEKNFLNDLKKALTVQQGVEAKIINMAGTEGRIIYESMGKNAVDETLAKLSALIKIQSKVGNDLIKGSKIFVSGTKVYSTLQVILAIVIGIMIVAIVSASNAVKIQSEKFNLN
ncbi:MCP four helix bundle domain-containing protein [Pedobacter sp. ISL-68]|uniref:MCP four helix bundle domain-containing protein n=1 Tax=unclassified Pedobacter TaxID=2628915 RepID=UPI001BEBCA86|nr:MULTISPECIES: MCP four helix bundle domain-containing protein [unclassified Pedobacter]MBT2561065.1 MCP four helix bundle domain-containing protein [Pedobacter sp. ISL-64]MBT2590454.1 MCP four helix bundle domain-containing protein [Pedobacter sp. ISL-68]